MPAHLRSRLPPFFSWKNLGIDLAAFLSALLGLVLFLLLIPLITYTYFAKDLESPEKIMNKNDGGVILYDRSGSPFFTLFEAKHKTFAPLSEISPNLIHALIASEDRDFYSHPGFSLKAIIRSVISDIKRRELLYGGSTITQQLVKNALLNPQKNFLRKYQEAVLAYEIERRFTKEQILEMYLNSIYFGEGAFGAEEAAYTYFDKGAKDLSPAESALLVGILPAPSDLSPLTYGIEKSREHQKAVLQKMLDQKYISKSEKEQAENEELLLNPQNRFADFDGAHFAFMVRDELIKKYGEEMVARSGFKVKTTLDMEKQRFAQKTVIDQVQNLAVNNVTNGAVVVLDPKTGQILAVVGSIDWDTPGFGKVNVATSPRQPGSAFKPLVYSVALERGLITPATILKDQPATYGGNFETPYQPKNYDDRFRGLVTVRRALANSLNVPAVEVISKLGVSDAIKKAHQFGITTLEDYNRFGLSLVLGAGEVKLVDLTSAYAVFANQGFKNEATTILEIRDKENKVIYALEPNPQLVLKPEAAFLISSILSDNGARAEMFGDALTISRPAAVKTGTTENYRDSLTVGYTSSLVIGVWVGNNDGSSMDNVAGSLGAAPIWKTLMEKFLEGSPVENFNPPEGVIALYNCSPGGKSYQEYFIKGTELKEFCPNPPPPSQPIATPSPTQPQPTNTPPTNPAKSKSKKATFANCPIDKFGFFCYYQNALSGNTLGNIKGVDGTSAQAGEPIPYWARL